MSLHGKLTAVLCALAVALGVAACGGGGGGSSGPDKAASQRMAVERAIDVAGERFIPLAGDPTEAEVKAAADAVAAARKALTDADALPDDDRETFDGRISTLEENLATVRARIANARDARRLMTREEATKITAALSGARITGISAAVTHEAAPVMSGTVPGTPAVSVADLETDATGVAATASGWKRGLYGVPDDAGALVDTVVLYTNIEAPGTRPFSGENGRYGDDNGLDTEGNLPIVAATDATLIRSENFPTGPGIREHEEGAGGTVLVAGTFDHAPGTYVCTPTEESACRSSIKHGGGIELSGGDVGWKFVPAEGATVPEPDGEHQHFGWWLRNTDGNYAVGVFHRGVGGATDEFTDLPALQGPATYTGPAAGVFAIIPQPGDASVGDFTATVTLEADFGDGTDLGTVEGTVDDFMVDGEAKNWSVELGSARIGTHGSLASGGSDTALTRWTIGDATPETTGTWSGQFHEVGLDRTPTVATGRFDAVHGTIGRMTGAFGATR